MSGFIVWLFRTKSGNAVGLAALILLLWWIFSSHYEAAGYAACQAENDRAIAQANVTVKEGQDARDKKTDAISDKAREAGSSATAEIDTKTTETKEVIRYVYKTEIKTVPVAAGSCVHPVDGGVQDRIDAAYRQAYGG